MSRAVLLDRVSGKPVVDRAVREALEGRDAGRIADLIERGALRPDIVNLEANPPLYMDVSSAYSGDELGLPWRDVISEGIVGAGDLLVSGHAAANSIDIAKGTCWVLGDTNVDRQPNYRCFNDAIVNLGISPDPSNPRRVLVIAQITDQTFAGTGRVWALSALHGTPAASPSLPALPASALPLADLTVPAAAANSAAYTYVDLRARASVGGGQASGGGGGGGPAAIDFRNPGVVTNTGNVYPLVTSLTAWEAWEWIFKKDVAGDLYGIVRAPGTANKVVLSLAWNATAGVSRMSIAWAAFADAASANPAALTGIAAQDITVPATARNRKDVTFTLGSTPAAGSIVIVKVTHEGAHANDTVAVDTEMFGGWFTP